MLKRAMLLVCVLQFSSTTALAEVRRHSFRYMSYVQFYKDAVGDAAFQIKGVDAQGSAHVIKGKLDELSKHCTHLAESLNVARREGIYPPILKIVAEGSYNERIRFLSDATIHSCEQTN